MFSRNTLHELRAALASALKHPAFLVGFIAAVAGPFTILVVGGSRPHNLPWYFWIGGLFFLATVISAGFVMFARDTGVGKEISINPDRL